MRDDVIGSEFIHMTQSTPDNSRIRKRKSRQIKPVPCGVAARALFLEGDSPKFSIRSPRYLNELFGRFDQTRIYWCITPKGEQHAQRQRL
jgi:hypothetical protein